MRRFTSPTSRLTVLNRTIEYISILDKCQSYAVWLWTMFQAWNCCKTKLNSPSLKLLEIRRQKLQKVFVTNEVFQAALTNRLIAFKRCLSCVELLFDILNNTLRVNSTLATQLEGRVLVEWGVVTQRALGFLIFVLVHCVDLDWHVLFS